MHARWSSLLSTLVVVLLVLGVLASAEAVTPQRDAASSPDLRRAAAADTCATAKESLTAAEAALGTAKGKVKKAKAKLKKSRGAKAAKAKRKLAKAKQGKRGATAGVAAAQATVSEACKPMAPVTPGPTGPVSAEGTVHVEAHTPDGVPANVRITGPAGRVLAKPDTGTTASAAFEVPAGAYEVVAEPSVAEGRFYAGTADRSTITLAGGKGEAVSVTYNEVETAREPYATNIDTSSVSLAWTAPGAGAEVELRRTNGNLPASTRTEGAAVPTSGATATDSGLSAATTYTYALFTKVDGVWWGPVPLTIGTLEDSPEGSEVFQAAPGSVVFKQADVVGAVSTADGAAVAWPTDMDLPVVGTGVVLPATEGLPSGFLGVVAEVLEDGRTVLLAPAGIGDVFDLYSIDLPDLDGLQEIDLDDPGPAAATGSARAAKKSSGPFSCDISDGADVKFEAEPTFDTPQGHYRMGINRYAVLGGSVPSGAWWDVKAVFPAHVPIDLKISAKASCAAKFKKGWTKKIWVVPVAFVLDAKAELSMDGATEVKNLGYDLTTGFETSTSLNFGTRKFTSNTSKIGHLTPRTPTEVSASVKIGTKVTSSVLVGPGTVDKKAETGAVAGIKGELTLVDATAGPTASVGGQPYCYSIEAKGAAKLDLIATVWFKPTNKWVKKVTEGFEFPATHPLINEEWQYLNPPRQIPAGCADSAPEITTDSLPGATIGTSYSPKLNTADNRNGTWTIVSGALPAGLSLSSDGQITGTPTGPAGMSSFVVKFTDPNDLSATKSLSITVTGSGSGDPGDPPSEIGEEYAGGIYVGTTQDDNGSEYALVASPRDLQFATHQFEPYLYWDNYYWSHDNTYRTAPHASHWDGLRNTQEGAAVDEDYRIFRHVSNMESPQDGGSPWYVPAKNELKLMWYALGEPGLAFDYALNGQTQSVSRLWSSTEWSPGGARFLFVRGALAGGEDFDGKGFMANFGVRPVRRIALG